MNTSAVRFFGALCALLLIFSIPAFSQATMSQTTTSATVGRDDAYIYVAATTGMAAIGVNNQVNTRLYIDAEPMDVLSVDSSTRVRVRRAVGNRRAAHISGATVYFGPPNYFGASDPPLGACTATSELVLPLVVPSTKTIWNCTGSPSTWQVINGAAAANVGVTALGPATAGNVAMGSAALPFQKIYLGTAATNNMIITPAATAAARTITMSDPGGAATLAYSNPTTAQTISNTTVTVATNTGHERVAHAKYSFATDGGAQGAITPAITASIPDNAIITRVVINSTSACTSDGNATVAIGTSAGSSATALIGATAIASLGADALVIGTPVPQTANTWVKMSAAGNIIFTVGTADLKTGVIEVWVYYNVAGA